MIIHPSGTDLKVWVEALATDGSTEYKSTAASLTAFGSTNGGTPAELTGVTAEFNSEMDMFLVTIPASQLPANGNNFFAVVDWEGIIDVKIEAYITDIHTPADIAAVDAEKIVPADKYTFNASAKTIILASPYDTITVEQVLSIRNLTKNMLLYDCTMTNRSSISIDAGVITHTYSGTMEDTDKLMIIVNMA